MGADKEGREPGRGGLAWLTLLHGVWILSRRLCSRVFELW